MSSGRRIEEREMQGAKKRTVSNRVGTRIALLDSAK
jgi:hypothetical protein